MAQDREVPTSGLSGLVDVLRRFFPWVVIGLSIEDRRLALVRLEVASRETWNA